MDHIKKNAKKYISGVKAAGDHLRSEIKKNILTAVLAAFGFIIALVWRDAIQAWVNELIKTMGIEGTGYIYQLITAAIITIICVVGILIFSKIKGEEDVKE